MKNIDKNNNFHIPVLLNEVCENLKIEPGKWYIDCTLGGGGHTLALLKQKAKVIAIDQDKEALSYAKSHLQQACPEGEFRLVHENFANLQTIVKENDIKALGILFDLGVSSFQLGGNKRGFSFLNNEPLDMRQNPDTQLVTAADLVNGLYEKELEKLIKKYGEEQLAWPIAHALVRERSVQPIRTTGQLAEIIAKVYKKHYLTKSFRHPATKTFQALRIAVNDEINNLNLGLDFALQVLSSKGRIAVISFNGLEDKIVKQKFELWENQNLGKLVNKNAILPSEKEIISNPRSRSAKLRVFEKI